MAAKTEEERTVLDPDHPLLKRFQEALKENYLSQINRLKNEIFEYEAETKKKSDEKGQLGVQVYELQQIVCRQQKTLDELVNEVQTISAARQEIENQLQEDKGRYKELRERLIAAERSKLELQNEINSVNLLINQVSQWESRIESNITVNQRIAEKTRKDNLRLSEEKRQQDAQIYKIMHLIWNLEAEVETINMQIILKETEREELKQTVALGNTNLEALQAEYRCLIHSWNSVVVAIGSRDRIIQCLRTEEMKVHEKIKSAVCEINRVKKLTRKEMNENQRLLMTKKRTEANLNCDKLQLNEEMKKYNEYARNIGEMQVVIDQTDRDIVRTKDEIRVKEMQLKRIIKDFNKIYARKYELEKTLLENLENQAVNNSVADNLYRNLSAEREKRKDLEIIMNEARNKQTKSLFEIETQRSQNEENQKALSDIEKQKNDLEGESERIQIEKDHHQVLFWEKQRHITVLNSKYEKTLEKMQVKVPISPQELRMSTLEKQVLETQDCIKFLQAFWLREQKNLLRVSQERQEQLYQLNLLKKQNMILIQKNLKVSNELENYKKQEEQVLHKISNLQNQTMVLCNSLYKKRDRKANLDKSNYHLQSQYDGKLKDSELECLEIEAEIADIEEEKASLSQNLIELNREALEWEKKIKLTRQTKEEIRGNKGQTSDIANMKQEIQRMNVIYSGLKKAQEKLVKDLEHCVSRRDAIFMVAEARQSRSKTSEQKMRINYTRKMDDIRNKIRKMEGEMKNTNDKLTTISRQRLLIEQDIENNKNDINLCESHLKTLKKQIEKRKTSRQLKFELLVMTQRQLNVYRDLVLHRTPFLHTKRENMREEHAIQKDLNNKLSNVVMNLKSDFPNHQHEFSRLYNTLKLTEYTQYLDA
ncbi:coiled-coil domain-containing protein 40-like [Euwallacea fornicatus]|uniref:coiled-coil domain-containing protein 40-like n=1 Tax=Euwallacea fornicatus TaxID=995702 RepID=UPI00338E9A8F